MRFVRLRAWRAFAPLAVAALAATLGLGCADGFEPLSRTVPPAVLAVEAVRPGVVRLRWAPVEDPDVIGYSIERRVALAGPFVPYVDQVPQTNLGEVSWLDTEVDADTYYGYRVYTVTRFGDRSRPSVVGGTRTPPPPGIEVAVSTTIPSPESADPDGYRVTVTGPDTVQASLGANAKQRFSPLRIGRYTVTVADVASRCAVDGQVTRTVDVTDTTALTIVPVDFHVACRDPNRGDVTVTVASTGQQLDDGHLVDLLGEADDAALPDSLRIVSLKSSIGAPSGSTRFINLRPGTFEVTLGGLAANCAAQGGTRRQARVTPLGNTSITFDVACQGSGGGNTGGKFVWRNTWTPAAAGSNARVKLLVELDLTASAAQRVQGVQAVLNYDPALLRFEVANAKRLSNLTTNTATPGVIAWLAATGNPAGGVVPLAEFEFTVTGASGRKAATLTQEVKAGAPAAFQDSVRIVEDTLDITTATSNQPPVARANGPYASAVNSAIAFSAAGSSDPDGTITSYSWSIGGTTRTGASVTHTFTQPGNYVAVLTVTDNGGATDTAQAAVTVTATTSNQPPVAEANGPYAATVGAPVTLSAAGSRDPDGSIVSYSWALGNGQVATGSAPTVTYAAAGAYTATLTVTDDKGATATDQATVNVGGASSGTPLVWENVAGPVDVASRTVSLSVRYDLRADLPETTGPEALQTFVVDSLRWDPAVLELLTITFGPNVIGTSDRTAAAAGRIRFNGNVSYPQAQGLVAIATLQFRLVGAAGTSTTTRTTLGTLRAQPQLGGITYNARTRIVEATFTTP